MTPDQLPPGMFLLRGRPEFDGRDDTAFLYVLVRGEVVVYVGVTGGDLRERLGAHRRGDRGTVRKVFDAVYYGFVAIELADAAEHSLIDAARPVYNREGITARWRPIRTGAFARHLSRPARKPRGKGERT